jgi:hypothetical protein
MIEERWKNYHCIVPQKSGDVFTPAAANRQASASYTFEKERSRNAWKAH